MKANYHTHLSLCGHAEGMTEDYVKEAINVRPTLYLEANLTATGTGTKIDPYVLN